MPPLSLTFASRPYDGIMPIVRGDVGISGVDIRPRLDSNVPRVFAALFNDEVDMSEMSLAELVYYTSRDKAGFVAIPVFPSRVFRHGYLFYDPRSGIAGPEGLNGRRLGFQRWVQTAGVWQRGMLVEHYGVSPADTQWFVGSIHHWADEAEDEVQPRDGSVIRRYQASSDPLSIDAFQALADGEVDVVGVTEGQGPEKLARFPRVFAGYRNEEREYFRRTRIFPIMHVLAMQRRVAEAHPELPAELFGLFARSKKLAQANAAAVPSWTLAWRDSYLADEQELFGEDLWPFGVTANQHVLDTFFGYCWQQGIAARHMAAAELFHASTCDLAG
jgi:4,5-dihydroxyphthalate decarboxylase